ncbi:protein NRT1/ PTR FAMILY 5.4-like [Castanea sativa]|uniref:protein NRT1/ PTR FAMILY 5.4-like n=1 Tax=Castanea sativa TaxID=21020 RepID=UPI003F64DF9F
MSNGCLSKIYCGVKEWYRYYIFFSKPALFILGFVLSHSLVELAVAKIMIVYLTDNWKRQNLPKAVVIMNLQDGVATILAVVLSYIADSYTGRFAMIVFTSIAYISGLVLLWYSAEFLSPSKETRMFYVAAVMIALGKSGRDPPLRAFFADQFIEKEENSNIEGQEKIDSRANVWWRIAWFSGASIAFFCLSNPNTAWKKIFLVSALVMGANLLLFLFGFTFYYRKPPERSPVGIIVRVFMAAIYKLHLNYPRTEEGFHWKNHTPSRFYENHIGQTCLLPKVLLFGWLDKAAIIDEQTPSISLEVQEDRGQLCTVEQVREVKGLFTLIPIWITFFGYSLVVATGSTFFFEQSSNMDFYIGNNVQVPISSFVVLESFISFIIPFLFWSKKARQQSVTRIRIGVGMVCSILSCIAAWWVEVHRLNLIQEERIDPSDISMSVLWLVPQFSLLGLMDGLASNGLQEFFYNRVTTSMRSYGPPFSDCVLGFGNFISIPLVLLFKSWFKDTINTSHLDRYYLALATLNFVFLCIYAYASSGYFNMESASNDEESNESLEDGNDELADHSRSTRNITPYSSRSNQMGNASEEVELIEIKVDGTNDTTRSVSSSLRRRYVATAATAIGFSIRLIDRFSRESPSNIVDSPESMEEALLQSRALTEAENELSDDEPGSQQD